MHSVDCPPSRKIINEPRILCVFGVRMKIKPNKLVKLYLIVYMITTGILAFSAVFYVIYEASSRPSTAKNQCAKAFARQFNTIVSLGGVSWLVLALTCFVILGLTYRRFVGFQSGNKGNRHRYAKLVIAEACVCILLSAANLALQSRLLAANDSQETSCLNRYLTDHNRKRHDGEVP